MVTSLFKDNDIKWPNWLAITRSMNRTPQTQQLGSMASSVIIHLATSHVYSKAAGYLSSSQTTKSRRSLLFLPLWAGFLWWAQQKRRTGEQVQNWRDEAAGPTERMMMMMRYYGNTWVAMLMLITNIPMYVNKEVWKKRQAEMKVEV